MTYCIPSLLPQTAALHRRLHLPDHYSLETVFQSAEYSWPGDYEGRYLLALSRLQEITGEPDAVLSEFLDRLPSYLNAQGDFGAVQAAGHWDEQQLSGHGWLLRGLVAPRRASPDVLKCRRLHDASSEILQRRWRKGLTLIPGLPRRAN